MGDDSSAFMDRMLLQGSRGGMGGGNVNELANAFQNFNQGLRSYQLSQSLQGANEQIQQIRDSDAADEEKRSQMSQVAQGLTMHMLQYGSPAQAIQEMQRAVEPEKPPLLQSPTEVMAYGTPEQKQSIKDFMQFKSDLDAENQTASPTDPLRQQAADEKRDEFNTRQLMNVKKSANEFEQTSRSVLGQLATRQQKAGGLNALLMKDPANQSRIELTELATGLDTIFRGGVATESGTAGLIPDTIQMKMNALKEMAGDPGRMNIPKYINLYNDILNRTQDITEAQIQAGKKQSLRAAAKIAKRSPDDFATMANELVHEKPDVDAATGKVSFPSDAAEDKLAGNVRKILANPDDQMDPQLAEAAMTNPNFYGAMLRNPDLGKKMRMFKARMRGAE